MVRIPTHHAPIHPGEMLLEQSLHPMHRTVSIEGYQLGIKTEAGS